MEETIKIYAPLRKNTAPVKTEKKKSNVVYMPKKQTKMETLMEVFHEHEKSEAVLMKKYPWFNIIYNWIIALLVLALFFSFSVWGVRIHNDHKAETLIATALADYKAEQDAAEQERLRAVVAQQQTEEHIVNEMANALAKVFYGAKNFEEKYRYQESDFETLARCVFNRVENKTFAVTQKAEAVANGEIELDENGKPLDERDYIYTIISHEDQWVGYYSNNPVLDKYQKMATKFIKAWRSEETKPISNDYLWAEFTPNGIFLKNDFHAGAYAHRYHA